MENISLEKRVEKLEELVNDLLIKHSDCYKDLRTDYVPPRDRPLIPPKEWLERQNLTEEEYLNQRGPEARW